MTLPEMEAHVGVENVTSNDVLHAHCMKPIKTRRGQKLGFYGYLEVRDVELTQVITDDIQLARWDVTSSNEVTLADFLLLPVADLVGPTSIIALTAHDFGGGRKEYTSSWHAMMWLYGVSPFGYTVEDFITYEEAQVIEALKGAQEDEEL